MARKLQVLIELDLESHDVKVTAPWNHAGAVVKMCGQALIMAGDEVARRAKASDEALTRAREGRTEAGLVVPPGVARA